MSGIYIPGMDMPTSCTGCPMLEGDRLDGLCHAASRWLDDDEYWTWYVFSEGDTDDSKPYNCPLVPVPEHGGLIDRDKLEKDIDNYIGGEESRSRFHHWVQVQRSVIPKSEEEQT